MSEWIEIIKGDVPFKGYLSLPKSGSGPGLILLQEIFGVNAYMRQMADLFSAEGYATLVPDLFWRMKPGVDLDYGQRDEAVSFMKRFDSGTALNDISAAVAALKSHPATNGKVAVLGYCLGGKLVLESACRDDVACAVSYYGVGIDSIVDEAAKSRTPMILHFAELDHYNPPATVEKIRKVLSVRNDVETYVYPGADHGFNSQARQAFHQNASLQAHARTMKFLDAYHPSSVA
jgi:carboxymethylenebutenolidase